MPLDRLLASLRPGGDFERVCKWALENVPEYRQRLRQVWLWDEWPGRWGRDAAGEPGVLAYSFANESAALFAHARFEGVGSDPRIIVGKGAPGGGVRLAYGADDTQRVEVRDSLAKLKANGWVEVEVVRGVTTIRPGERMRKLWPKAHG